MYGSASTAAAVDDVKSRWSMAEVLSLYGIAANRAGMICCPFHDEKTPSCKIYKDHYHCFACGAHGDQISFVMQYERISFKDAFHKLGGEDCGSISDAVALRIASRKAKQRQREKDVQRAEKRFNEAISELRSCERIMQQAAPFSDEFCEAANKIPLLEYRADDALENLFRAYDMKKGGGKA